MNNKIAMILQELYELDPGLRDKEEVLKKTIKELLSSKPDVVIDEKFEKELKRKLMLQFSGNHIKKKLAIWAWLTQKAVMRTIGSAAIVCIIAVVAIQNKGLFFQKQKTVAFQTADSAEGTKAENVSVRPEAGKPAEAQLRRDDIVSAAKLRTSCSQEAQVTERQHDAAKAKTKSPAGPNEVDKPFSYKMQSDESIDYRKADEEMSSKYEGASELPAPAPAQTAAGNNMKEPADVLGEARYSQDFNTEEYGHMEENPFLSAMKDPLSTLSIDVDTASYANIRRILNSGTLPLPDAVRVEEMINYFSYKYAEPTNDVPLAFHTELSECPWNKEHQLLKVGVQAKKINIEKLPPNNLVFLLDVSGSMEEENKLPLVKEALKLLVKQMRQQDKISIVVYAGAAGLVLPATSGNEKNKIMKAIDNLQAGGSTAGGEGIILAYETAKKALMKKGNNRVILATDGDFNVGISSDGELVRLIEEKRKEGIFLTVLGFGMGNYKDSKMVQLADKGNGNYAYIDTLSEAKKVLVNQMAGTLLTIAKDVKIQIEFNPSVVGEYRLIGYEKRIMRAQDFDDDKKDAGELGAGHTVTVLYEIAPAKGRTNRTDLKYQQVILKPVEDHELMTIKFRYKKPDEEQSRLLVYPIQNDPVGLKKSSEDFRFAAAVAEWGLLLKGSAYKANAGFDQVLNLAGQAKGQDSEGYRKEFVELVKISKELGRKK